MGKWNTNCKLSYQVVLMGLSEVRDHEPIVMITQINRIDEETKTNCPRHFESKVGTRMNTSSSLSLLDFPA